MALLLVDDDDLARVAAHTGHDVAPITDGPALREADVIVLREAWDRVRGWRAGGIRAGVVLVTQASPPPDRARLEPVVLLRDPARLSDALPQLFEGRPAGRLRLAAGLVDLDRERFEPPDAPPVALSTLECRLLGYLGSRAGRAISRDELQLQVWDHRRPLATRAVDMAISRLRRKIEPDPEHPVVLLTVRHRGYRLVPAAGPGLVGRHADLDEAEAALTDGPLLLHGAPGVGKTALARALADRSGRAILVDLTGISDLATAARALATAAQRPVPADAAPKDAIVRLYRQLAPGLVVWDGADDLLGADALIAPRVTGLRILLTRRAPLPALPGQRVDPLPVADAAALLARLTAERGLDLPSAALVDLARRLDRLPLALTLAASRLARLGADGLSALVDAGLAAWCAESALDRAVQRALADAEPEVRSAVALLARVAGPWDPTDLTAIVGPIWQRALDAGLLAREGPGFAVPRAIRSVTGSADPTVLVEVLARRAERLLERFRGDCAADAAGLTSRARHWEAARDAALELGDADAACALTALLDHLLAMHAGRPLRLASLQRALLPHGDHPAAARVWYRAGHAHAEVDRQEAEAAYRRAADLAPSPDLRVQAQLAAARMVRWTRGTRAALAELDDLDPSDASAVTRTWAAAGLLVMRDTAGEVGFEASIPGLRSCLVELAAAGWLRAAESVGLWLGGRLQRTGRLDEALRTYDQVVAWAHTGIDPVLSAEAELLRLTARAHVHARGDELLAELDLLERRLRDVRPQRVFQVLTVRGEVLAHLGRPTEARERFLEVHAWATRHGWLSNAVSAALWLADVEIDAGRPDRAVAWTQAALSTARELGDAHLLAHAELTAAVLDQLGGSRPDRIELTALSPVGVHVALALRGDLDALRAEIGGIDGAYGDAVRAELDGADGPLPRLLDARRVARVLRGSRRPHLRLIGQRGPATRGGA